MAQHPPNPLDDHTPKQPLTGFQASQLFINCCFALSLAASLGCRGTGMGESPNSEFRHERRSQSTSTSRTLAQSGKWPSG